MTTNFYNTDLGYDQKSFALPFVGIKKNMGRVVTTDNTELCLLMRGILRQGTTCIF